MGYIYYTDLGDAETSPFLVVIVAYPMQQYISILLPQAQ